MATETKPLTLDAFTSIMDDLFNSIPKEPPNTIVVHPLTVWGIREWDRRNPQTRRERHKWSLAYRKKRREYFRERGQTVKDFRAQGLNQYITGGTDDSGD